MASMRGMRDFLYDHEEDVDFDVVESMTHDELLARVTALGYVDPNPPRNAATLTAEEARDEVVDRIRGRPKAYLRELSNEFEMSFDEFMDQLRAYAEGDTDYIGLGFDTPDHDPTRMWDAYELVAKRVVPKDKRHSPFSCAC